MSHGVRKVLKKIHIGLAAVFLLSITACSGASDGDRSRTKLITVEHADGSVAVYSHLTLNGVHVTAGQQVLAGDAIGQSGNTGNTGGFPQLHFSLHPCRSLPGLPGTENCPSML
jgi:murein DD-endopeptidase MepM/ murein hydrolase activator NlpD